MQIQEFDNVILKDGQAAAIVEVYDATHFLADIGEGPEDWKTISITLDDIKEVTYHSS